MKYSSLIYKFTQGKTLSCLHYYKPYLAALTSSKIYVKITFGQPFYLDSETKFWLFVNYLLLSIVICREKLGTERVQVDLEDTPLKG